MNIVSAPFAPPPWSTSFRSTASKYSSNYDCSWPPGVSANTLNYSLQVDFWVHLMSASECLTKLAWSWPPSASPNLLEYGLQVHLWVHLTADTKSIFQLAWSQPPSATLRCNARCMEIQGLLLLLSNHIVFTLIRIWERPIPIHLRACQLDGGALLPLPNNQNFTYSPLPPPIPQGPIF